MSHSPSTPRALRLLLAALLALALGWAPAAQADDHAGGNGEDNAAVAVNQKDGSSVFDLAFEVRRVSNGVVDQTNTAVAYASCENCQTVAIAIQIVLVAGGADRIEPANIAIALNEQCTSCQTLAVAYQFVFGGGDVLEFTKEGRTRLREIRKELKGLEDSGLSVDEIRARVTLLAGEIGTLLATELVPRKDDDEDGGGGGGGGGEQDDPSLDDEDQLPPEEPAPEEPSEPIDPADEPPPPTTDEQPTAPTEPPPTEPAPGEEPTAPPTP